MGIRWLAYNVALRLGVKQSASFEQQLHEAAKTLSSDMLQQEFPIGALEVFPKLSSCGYGYASVDGNCVDFVSGKPSYPISESSLERNLRPNRYQETFSTLRQCPVNYRDHGDFCIALYPNAVECPRITASSLAKELYSGKCKVEYPPLTDGEYICKEGHCGLVCGSNQGRVRLCDRPGYVSVEDFFLREFDGDTLQLETWIASTRGINGIDLTSCPVGWSMDEDTQSCLNTGPNSSNCPNSFPLSMYTHSLIAACGLQPKDSQVRSEFIPQELADTGRLVNAHTESGTPEQTWQYGPIDDVSGITVVHEAISLDPPLSFITAGFKKPMNYGAFSSKPLDPLTQAITSNTAYKPDLLLAFRRGTRMQHTFECIQTFSEPCPSAFHLVDEYCIPKSTAAIEDNSRCGTSFPATLSIAERIHKARHCAYKWPCHSCIRDYIVAKCPVGYSYDSEAALCLKSVPGLKAPPEFRFPTIESKIAFENTFHVPFPCNRTSSCRVTYVEVCPRGFTAITLSSGKKFCATEHYSGHCKSHVHTKSALFKQIRAHLSYSPAVLFSSPETIEEKSAFERLCTVEYPCSSVCTENLLSPCPALATRRGTTCYLSELLPNDCNLREISVLASPYERYMYSSGCGIKYDCMLHCIKNYDDCPLFWKKYVHPFETICEPPIWLPGKAINITKLGSDLLMRLEQEMFIEFPCT